ncbi:NAD(P)-dependent oxidoreductase [Chitinophaga polysaccharea]|uniref:NAD-dependent epimerase/dehydratase family protein n=1 Tax=Chitinophaga TaxID=79328 RepID=UPI00145596BE|nr:MULTISPECIES: NAD(P)-dependent oxidoreductase [Chitinophaga]NLR57388.1 NAD(P)-dependent oxidoreductase [Chitinophaga polysaccharea]NLU92540.1 NAD(P)-dependent oxidoreductase [Chitinophaga sp. Ak27]
MKQLETLVDSLLQPSAALVADMAALEGDILILGVGGKIGPSLAKLARQAIDRAGVKKRVIGVSRLTEPGLKEQLEQDGIEAIAADLMNDADLQALPDVENVLYLAGTKFGTTGKEAFTWAMNTYLPGRVAEKYRHSRIVVYSTGNVYPFTPVAGGGADESTAASPLGEYGQSCLGRERIFQHFSGKYQTPLLVYRLNYANDLHYGVLLEIAKAVREERPIDIRMGHVNVIWQGDANEMALRGLLHCAAPAKLLNITGPETAPVKWIAREFGKLFGKTPQFTGEEQPTALLSNAAESFRLFGYPKVSLKQMIGLTAAWLEQGGRTIQKETHFQEREGQY